MNVTESPPITEITFSSSFDESEFVNVLAAKKHNRVSAVVRRSQSADCSWTYTCQAEEINEAPNRNSELRIKRAPPKRPSLPSTPSFSKKLYNVNGSSGKSMLGLSPKGDAKEMSRFVKNYLRRSSMASMPSLQEGKSPRPCPPSRGVRVTSGFEFCRQRGESRRSSNSNKSVEHNYESRYQRIQEWKKRCAPPLWHEPMQDQDRDNQNSNFEQFFDGQKVGDNMEEGLHASPGSHRRRSSFSKRTQVDSPLVLPSREELGYDDEEDNVSVITPASRSRRGSCYSRESSRRGSACHFSLEEMTRELRKPRASVKVKNGVQPSASKGRTRPTYRRRLSMPSLKEMEREMEPFADVSDRTQESLRVTLANTNGNENRRAFLSKQASMPTIGGTYGSRNVDEHRRNRLNGQLPIFYSEMEDSSGRRREDLQPGTLDDSRSRERQGSSQSMRFYRRLSSEVSPKLPIMIELDEKLLFDNSNEFFNRYSTLDASLADGESTSNTSFDRSSSRHHSVSMSSIGSAMGVQYSSPASRRVSVSMSSIGSESMSRPCPPSRGVRASNGFRGSRRYSNSSMLSGQP